VDAPGRWAGGWADGQVRSADGQLGKQMRSADGQADVPCSVTRERSTIEWKIYQDIITKSTRPTVPRMRNHESKAQKLETIYSAASFSTVML